MCHKKKTCSKCHRAIKTSLLLLLMFLQSEISDSRLVNKMRYRIAIVAAINI